jgi:hypothetical protein
MQAEQVTPGPLWGQVGVPAQLLAGQAPVQSTPL